MRSKNPLNPQLISPSLRLLMFLLTLSVYAGAQPQSAIPTQNAPPSQPSVQVTPQTDLTDVAVKLPPTSRGIYTFNTKEVRFEAETVVVGYGDSVVKMLAENGIRQDVTALSLVYDLNPGLADIEKIKIGEKLVIPDVEGSAQLERALASGYRVLLVRQLAAEQTLVERKQELDALQSKLSTLTDEHFTRPEDKTEFLSAVQESSASIDALRNPKEGISSKVLLQAAIELQQIKTVLGGAADRGEPLSPDVLGRIKPNLENLRATADEVRAGRSPLVPTVIRTKHAVSGQPVSQLRVWYAPTGDRKLKHPCSELSPLTNEAITRGEYVFWATRDDDVVSDEVTRFIRIDTQTTPIDLYIKK
ncbi:MAG: hypothetical protein QOG71_383 [Pyrinomonadaceae bacterium]|nr:hypothetical protein [Pyrinomonadaceae bacterium]